MKEPRSAEIIVMLAILIIIGCIILVVLSSMAGETPVINIYPIPSGVAS